MPTPNATLRAEHACRVRVIDRHSHLYHFEAAPVAGDAEYDALKIKPRVLAWPYRNPLRRHPICGMIHVEGSQRC